MVSKSATICKPLFGVLQNIFFVAAPPLYARATPLTSARRLLYHVPKTERSDVLMVMQNGAAPRPNLVFLLADDMGAWALHCAGNTDIHTPNLDRMARRGMRFDNFFCASPVCSPARASILTGTMPSRHGVLDWLDGGNLAADHPFAQGRPAFAHESRPIRYLESLTAYTDLLAQAGYHCGLCGKWHLGDSLHPQHGFTDWYTIARGGCDYFHPEMVEKGEVYEPDGNVTNLLATRAVEWLQRYAAQDAPFYLSVHFTAPHDPWDADQHPREYLDLYKDCAFTATPDLPLHPNQVHTCQYGTGARRKELLRGYYAAISAMDHWVGRILDQLEESGVLDNTIVVFTSDNGMNLGQHGIWGKGNGTFPQNMYDSSVKVPFLMMAPGRVAEGTVCEEMFSHYDLFPTLCELCGVPCRSIQPLPGHSFAPWLTDPDRQNPAPVVVYDEYGPVRMIRRRDCKLVLRTPYGPNELYDLVQDPGEEHNLYGQAAYEPLVLALSREMDAWFRRYADPAFDARCEGVAGTGQHDRPGCYASLADRYGPRPAYVKEK